MVPLSSLTSIPAVKLYNGIGYLLIWENSEDQNTFCNPLYSKPKGIRGQMQIVLLIYLKQAKEKKN
jgi:hypothetical protein